nr:NADH dehydrogenase subunit 4L [Sphaerodactylus elegans]
MTPHQLLTTTLFALGALGLTLHRKHLVSALLCIEGMLLSLFISMGTTAQTNQLTTTTALPIILLALSACEASIGLGLLVASTRTHASDHLKTLDLLKC